MKNTKKILSNAKINLGLYITGKRNDGYHNIETLFLPVSLYDELTIERSPDIVIGCSISDIPVDERNTIFKAIKLLHKKLDINYGCEIFLNKRIPHGAGLGGGSSNAAFVLKALSALWGLDLKQEELMEIGLEIGSDVPFFIINRPSIGRGRGEILRPIFININFRILLIYPELIINTGSVYKQLKIDLTKDKKSVTFFTNLYCIEDLIALENLENHLEPIVFREYPHLKDIKDDLYNAGAVFSSMSGSGSTIFGLFNEDFDLANLKEKYSKNNQVYEVSPINLQRS